MPREGCFFFSYVKLWWSLLAYYSLSNACLVWCAHVDRINGAGRTIYTLVIHQRRRISEICSVPESCSAAEHRVFSQALKPTPLRARVEVSTSRKATCHAQSPIQSRDSSGEQRSLKRSPIFCVRLPFAARDVQMICGERYLVVILTFPAHPRDGPGKGSPSTCAHLIKPRFYLILILLWWTAR